jgi:hypothetical protein
MRTIMQVLCVCVCAEELIICKLSLFKKYLHDTEEFSPSQGKHGVFITKSNRLMLFRYVMAIYSENCIATCLNFVRKTLKLLKFKAGDSVM